MSKTANTKKRDFIATRLLDDATLNHLIDRSLHFFKERRAGNAIPQFLKDFSVATFFLENSTRTRTSFELAASLAGAPLVSIPTETSSLKKGETIDDTLHTLDAMRFDAFIMRQADNELPFRIAPQLRTSLINAGAGTVAHPSQALLDASLLTLEFGSLKGLNIAICGDIVHSRVAASLLDILPRFGAKVKLIGPKTFLPSQDQLPKGVELSNDMDTGLSGVDAVYCLRVQKERMPASECPNEQDYLPHYGLTKKRLAALSNKTIVLHPGPINRGMEIESEVADGQQSRILEQVEMGVAARLAILEWVAGN